MNKFEELKKYLINLKKQGICLAFSGGIDSTVLLYICKDLDITAVTFASVFQTCEEINCTKELCQKYNVKHKIINLNPLENEILLYNPKDRCYHCKKGFFAEIKEFAEDQCIIDGTNFDDLSSYRPGLKALKELGVISPLAMFKITKQEIRQFAKSAGIEIFDKPSAPCIATRFPYGTKLNECDIEKVKRAEEILKKYGFVDNRARLHDDILRVEIAKRDFNSFINLEHQITNDLKELNFKYITLDIEGLRQGSMDI